MNTLYIVYLLIWPQVAAMLKKTRHRRVMSKKHEQTHSHVYPNFVETKALNINPNLESRKSHSFFIHLFVENFIKLHKREREDKSRDLANEKSQDLINMKETRQFHRWHWILEFNSQGDRKREREIDRDRERERETQL